MNRYVKLIVNAILLALMSAISTLIADYVLTRCVPSINVVYGAVLFGISVLITTLYTSMEKSNGTPPPANPAPPADEPKGADVLTVDPPDPPKKNAKGEDWLIGMVF